MIKKIEMANLPTKIEKLEIISEELKKNIFVKRDDQTGTEISGNKIRKLEYALREALDQGCDTLITCGGIQSNHARATAVAGIKLGLKSILLLRSDEKPDMDGNYFLDTLLGAEVRLISSEDYSERRAEIMEDIKSELNKTGRKAYIIPEGASNGIGTLGYYSCMKEILEQEKEMGIEFDTVVATVGSAGTYAGLYLGDKVFKSKKNIVGINISADAEHFKNRSLEILNESRNYLEFDMSEIKIEDMKIIDGYVGQGYAKSSSYELDFIKNFASKEGIILDPVYTGKAMYGLYNEIKKGNFEKSKNILFIHTGGLFGLFPKKYEFNF